MAQCAKRVCPDVLYQLRFPQPQTLKVLVDIIKDTIPEVSIEVVKTPDKDEAAIKIENIDDKRVCVVHARLSCHALKFERAGEEFNINLELLSSCLRSVQPHYVLDLTKRRESDSLEFTSLDAVNGTLVNKCCVPTLCQDFTKAPLNELNYDYTVQMELSTFRSIVKTSKELRANNLTFVMYEKTKQGKKHMLFCLRAEGDATQEHYFPAVLSDEGVMHADTESADAAIEQKDEDQTFKGHFSVQFLNTFLKAMERQMLSIRISAGKPLVIIYPLGAEDSHVCFVLAQKLDDEE